MIAASKFGRTLRNACAILAILASPLVTRLDAQTQQGSSVMDDILKRAENALNDLNYASALTFAKQVVDVGKGASPAARTKALLIIAAANYPEGEPSSQHRDVSLATFKLLVQSNFDIAIPQALRWAGLDSVLTEAKRTTFAIAVSGDSEQVVSGPTGRAQIKVRASRPSTFRLTVTQSGSSTVLATDSVSGSAEGVLHFPTMRNERPIFTTGAYDIVVTASDPLSSDTTGARVVAQITSPELAFAKVPVSIDSSRLQLEKTGAYGIKGIVVGALVGGGIYAFSNLMHADTTLKTKYGPDSKGTGIAVVAGAAVVLASFLDKGRTVPGAIVANQKLREDLASSIRATESENASRIATYKTTIRIDMGAAR